MLSKILPLIWHDFLWFAVKDPVSTSHGFAVMGAHFISKCRGAVTAIAVTAIYVTAICVTAIAVIAICVTAIYAAAIHVSAVHCQSGNVAVGPARIALRRLHAAGEVAFFNVLHAPVALAADGNALGLNAQRYAVVVVVQKSVVTLAIYVTSIFVQFYIKLCPSMCHLISIPVYRTLFVYMLFNFYL